MELASLTAIFVFMAFALMSLDKRGTTITNTAQLSKSVTLEPFCDSPATPRLESGEETRECKPCPGRCRQGELISCRRGFEIAADRQSCVMDRFFRSKVDLLKAGLERDLAERESVPISEVRAAKHGSEYDKVTDIALEELLERGQYAIDGTGRLISTQGRTSRLALALKMLFATLCITFLLGSVLYARRKRRTAPGADAELIEHAPIPSVTVPKCIICSDAPATEALQCGHLVACQSCVALYKSNMARTRDYRCPICRGDSGGRWLHIHGLS
jgi:hypothetical protein